MKPNEFQTKMIITKDAEMRGSARTSLNRLCDISDWVVWGPLTNLMKELGEGVYIHRKSWEYAMCISGLNQLGVVHEGARAIATGAGYERPLYYFANRIREMVATDLYDNPDHEGKPEMVSHPERFAPFDYRKDHLTVKRMDATDLDYGDETFDFAFSLSSIEHFGSRAGSKKAMREMERVMKKGGAACVATELILNRATHAEYFTLDELRDTIIDSTSLKLAGGELDLGLSRSLVENPIDLDVETNLSVSPHIVLKKGEVVWTSVILFFVKP